MTAFEDDLRVHGLLPSLLRQLRGKNLRPIAGNTGWVLGEKVGRALVSGLAGAIVARYLGPSQYAVIAYAVAITAFLVPVSQLGLTNIVVRDLALEPQSAGEIIGTTLLLRLIAGIVSLLGAALFLQMTEPDPARRLIGIMIAVPLVFQASEAIDLWFQSRLESRFGVRWRVLLSLMTNGVRLALVWFKMPLWTFAVSMSMELVLVAFALVLAYRMHPAAVAWRFSAMRARLLLAEGSAFMLSGLTIIVYMRIDQIMLMHFAGPAVLGRFAAVVALTQIFHILPVAMVTSLAPVIAQQATKNEAAYYRALHGMFIVLGVGSVLVSLGIVVFGGLAVSLLLGQEYQSAVPALQVYGFTNIAVALGVAWNVWATTSGKGKLLLVNTLCGCIVAVVANYMLIPRFGIMGAAIAANMSFFTSALLVNFFTCRDIFFLQLGIRRDSRKIQ